MQRYSDKDLELMLNDLESDLVERKQSFKGDVPKKARQAVCAFANDLPNHNKAGVLFIGAHDDGRISEMPVTDEMLRSLADMKTDGNILPLPVMTVEKRRLKGADIAVVTVHPSDMPPLKYEGRIWIRTGSRRAIANEQEERILTEKRRFKNIPFDIYPIPSAQLKDLDRVVFEAEYLPMAFAQDVLEANARSYEERLASCRMIVSPGNPVPTVLGLLALGKRTQDFLPGAYIQFLRIDGTELTDLVIDEEKIGGNVVQMLRRIKEKIASHNRTSVNITSAPTEIRKQHFPPAALHQLVYNAVFHRVYESTNAPVHVYWFKDRIEIDSPGGPFGNVTVDNFGKPGITDYRNPNLGEVMKNFGFIQAFGRGIATAKREMEKNGNPPIKFVVTQSVVLCVLRRI